MKTRVFGPGSSRARRGRVGHPSAPRDSSARARTSVASSSVSVMAKGLGVPSARGALPGGPSVARSPEVSWSLVHTASSPRDSAPPETRDGVSTTTRLCSSRSADRDAPGPDAFSARSRRSPRCAWRAPGIAAVRGPRGCEGGRFDILEKVCYWIRRRHAGNEVHPVRPRRAHRRRAWKLCVRPPSPPLASERGGAGSRDVDGRHPRYPETGPA